MELRITSAGAVYAAQGQSAARAAELADTDRRNARSAAASDLEAKGIRMFSIDMVGAHKNHVAQSIDRNGDGAISPDELAAVMADGGKDQANLAETYRAMDMDHDGKVSRQELAASMPFTPQDFLALVASSREAKLYQP